MQNLTDIEIAFQLVIEIVFELKDAGIDIVSTPFDFSKYDKYYFDDKKFSNTISKEYWRRITFKVKNENESSLINDKLNYIGLSGITFDHGAGKNDKDWELDWSFNYEKAGDDIEWRKSIKTINDLLGGFTN